MTQESFTRAVIRLRPHMVAVAARYVEGNEAVAEDLVQDTLLRLWQMHERLQMPMDAFALLVLRRRCIDHLRRRAARRRVEDVARLQSDEADDAEAMAEVADRYGAMLRAVEALPTQGRLLLRLRYMKGQRIEDIATAVGSNAVAVRKALSRARRQVLRFVAVGVTACLLVAVGVVAARHAYEVRQFDRCYAGSVVIVDGRRITNPDEMKPHVEQALSRADALQQYFQ